LKKVIGKKLLKDLIENVSGKGIDYTKPEHRLRLGISCFSILQYLSSK